MQAGQTYIMFLFTIHQQNNVGNCHAAVAQEYGDLEPALANPVEIARLQQLPAEALALLLLSPDLRVWGEGAALAGV